MKTFGKRESNSLVTNLLGRYLNLSVFIMALLLMGCGGGGGGGGGAATPGGGGPSGGSGTPLAPALSNVSSKTYTKNSAITLLRFVNDGGGSLTKCTASSLPAGLSLSISSDGDTCEIKGTPTAVQASTLHTITATNITGSHSLTMDVTVTDGVAILSLKYEQVKIFKFSWTEDSSANHYNLLENADGKSGFSEVAKINAGTLMYSHTVSLVKRVNAQYILQICYSADNSNCVDTNTVSVSGTLDDSIGYFKASNTNAADGFGSAVALSRDGKYLVVSSTAEASNATGINGDQTDNSSAFGSGAVYVFFRDTAGWSQQAYIKASNTESGDIFGAAVAINSNGNTLVVSAIGEKSTATGIGGDQTTDGTNAVGAVYVFSRSGTDWTQQEYIKSSNTGLHSFGISLSLSDDGNTLAVGDNQESSDSVGIGGSQVNTSTSVSGAVYIFIRSGITWTQQEYIKASNSFASIRFGSVVALDSSGNTLAVSAPKEFNSAAGIGGNQFSTPGAETGAVYVFTRSGTTWIQEEYIKASNTGNGDQFGNAIALSGDGTTLAVAAFQEGSSAVGVGGDQLNNDAVRSGAAYVFNRVGSTWTQQAYIKAFNTRSSTFFGNAIALSFNGDLLMVGAFQDKGDASGVGGDFTGTTTASGAVFSYSRDAGIWSDLVYIKAAYNNPADAIRFGSAITMSGDGNILAVGTAVQSGSETGVGGDPRIVDPLYFTSGAVFLY